MATDLEDKRGNTTNPDPGQSFYNREFANQTSPKNYSANAVSPRDLAEQEAAAGDGADSDTLGKGFNPVDQMPKFNAASKIIGRIGTKKVLVGGGLMASIASLIIFAFLSLLPLRILHIVNGVQDRFFGASEQASSDIGDKLFQQYIVTKVIPGMVKGKCSSTRVSKSCAVVNGANNPVGALYTAWSNARLEGKLYDTKGIEIVRDGNKFYYRSDSLRERVFMGEYNESNTRDFNNRAYTQLNRSDIRREIKTSLENETLRKRLMYRYSVGNLLERKYGIKRCVIACNFRDSRAEKLELRKTAFKSYLTERVLTPRSEALGLAFQCALASFNCAEPGIADQNGDRSSEFETKLQAKLLDYRSRLGSSSLEDLQADADRIKEKGFVDYAIRKIAGDAAGKVATKFIPIVGWLDFGARLVQGAKSAGPAIHKINFVMNTTSMVSVFALYRTTADEIKMGQPDLEVLGSVSDSFNANPSDDQGGTAAESSPLYQNIIGNAQASTPSFADALLPSAYAVTTPASSLKCDNGDSIAKDQLVCPELSFGAQSVVSKIADTLSNIANDPAFFFAGTVASIYLNTFGKIVDLAGQLFSLIIPNLSFLQIEEIVKWVTNNIFSKILINVVTDRPSGARKFDLLAGGADVTGNEYAHYGQGAPAASPQLVNEINARRNAEKIADFDSKSLYSRLFNTEDSNSLLSKVALAMPADSTKLSQSFAAIFFNPLKTLVNSTGSAFSNKTVSAATFTTDPFGIEQYAWPSTDAVFKDSTNLESYWDENDCSNPDQVKNWGNKGIIDPETLIVKHTVGNPCLLLRSSIASSGGKYDTSLLEPSGSGLTAPSSTAAGDIVNDGDLFSSSATLTCEIGIDGGVQTGYREGNPVPIKVCIVDGTDVNAKIVKNFDSLLKTANAQGVKLFGGSGFRTMSEQEYVYNCYITRSCNQGRQAAKPGFSNHQMGLAVDFTCNTRGTLVASGDACFQWLKQNAANYGFINLPSENWHWSVNGG